MEKASGDRNDRVERKKVMAPAQARQIDAVLVTEHTPPTLIGQRLFAIAMGYEDPNDHDKLRHDPVMAVLAGKLARRRAAGDGPSAR